MAYIKKLVMSGFKSFARRTEIIFDKGVNVVIGPNGSGKSNISDALCFVLGRLSIKSMRAAKARNLLFMGSKYIKPAREASVELIFDNTDRAFSIDKEEIVLARSVRHNGQSIYKINGEAKTRADIIEMLAQAGIDPHGFNLILQGQIQGIVRMHSEDRRKIIEEVAGISIYESRKEKSLHELEKTDEKLKEISAILRERTSYLRNLDKEREQALKFKDLELTIKRCKASILHRKLDEKKKELESIVKSIDAKMQLKDKIREKADKLQKQIESLSEEINKINRSIQQASGLEQEELHNGIANLKAELEGLRVRGENYENRKAEIERRIGEMQKSIPELEREISSLRKESPLMAKKASELKRKKDEFSAIEEERNKLYALKTEFHSIREISKDKERQIANYSRESESLLKQVEDLYRNLQYKNEEECVKALQHAKHQLLEGQKALENLRELELRNEKTISIAEFSVHSEEKVKEQVKKIETCPLCRSKMTSEHVSHVIGDAEAKIKKAKAELDSAREESSNIKEKRAETIKGLEETRTKMNNAEMEQRKHELIKDKKVSMNSAVEREKTLRNEIQRLEERRRALEARLSELAKVEEKYDSKLLEIEEISSRTEEDVDTTLLYKDRELENTKNIIKRSTGDLKDVSSEINNIEEQIDRKSSLLEQKEKQESELSARFKKMFELRDAEQKEMQEKSIELSEVQNEIRQVEDQINYLKVGKARLDAEAEAVQMELSEFPGIEMIRATAEVLEERMKRAQEAMMHIGSINMRALEVYEQIKKEYDLVQEKVQTLEKEKIEIMKIVEEIDKKKTRSFMKTFKAINTLFSENFAKLSSKGTAFLEIENQEDIFSAGISIVVKLAKGKYFDVTSLSGGEQTLVALSLLFAIQEYKPYHFYIFDEIDAALDKRNSERLAALLNQYMKSGQYIIVTHNDAIILNSNVLYGVSMHDGVSKILSLKVQDDAIKKEMAPIQQESEKNES
jgi:chromosome segregation protein